MKNLKYTYAPRGNQWVVLKWKYMPNGSCGETICYFGNKEDAKALAKHLNETEHLYVPAISQML